MVPFHRYSYLFIIYTAINIDIPKKMLWKWSTSMTVKKSKTTIVRSNKDGHKAAYGQILPNHGKHEFKIRLDNSAGWGCIGISEANKSTYENSGFWVAIGQQNNNIGLSHIHVLLIDYNI